MFKKFLRSFLACASIIAPLATPRAAEAQTLLSQGRPVVASSSQAPFVATNAVDGNTGTRWGSAFTNNEWIYVDLGATFNVSRVVLNWEARLRQRLPDPGLRQRGELDHHLHHHHGQRRHR